MKAKFFTVFFVLALGVSGCSVASPAATSTPTEIPATLTPTEVPATATPIETEVVPTNTPVPSPTITPVAIPDYIQNLNLETNPLNHSSAPVIQQGDWPALASETMQRYKQGELGAFPPESKFVPFSYLESGFMYKGMVHVLKPLGQPSDLWGMDGRWYFFTSIYREEGTNRVIAHYMVQQKDGTAGQFFSLLGTTGTLKAMEPHNLEMLAKGADDLYLEFADFSTTEACKEGWGDEAYCQQRVDNREVDLLLYHQWAQDGNVPEEFSSGKNIVVLAGQRVKK